MSGGGLGARFRLLRRAFPYRLRDLWPLLSNPVGRRKLRTLGSWLAWPLLSRVAALYRRTILRRTPVVAVTGSYGKSTTTAAVAAALGLPPPPALRGNSWSHLAVAVFAHRPGKPLVLEVGISRPGQMRSYARLLRPDVVVVTAVGGEHRLSLGTLEATQAEKGELVAGLARDGVAVLNGDDPRVAAMAARITGGGRVVRFGFGADSDVRGANVELDWPRGTRFRLATPEIELPARLALLGEPALRAALAAVAVAGALGVPAPEAAARLATLAALPGRMQLVHLPNGDAVLRDDLKSGIETVEIALATLGSLPATRRLAVLGDVNEPAASQYRLYRELGRTAAAAVSRILYVGRYFAALDRGARAAGLPKGAVTRHTDVHQVAAALSEELRPGDVVLLKGRNEQKLERVALLLAGRQVRCALRSCRARGLPCDGCPMLERGWETRRPVT